MDTTDKRTTYYDNKTIGLTTGTLSAEQISSAIKRLMLYIRTEFGYPAYFDLSYAKKLSTESKTKKLVPAGFCFLTVNRPEVYHLLCGNKPDGSENVDFIPDPDYVTSDIPSKKEEKEEKEDDIYNITSWQDIERLGSMNWADMIGEDLEANVIQEPPMIKVICPPLIPRAVVNLEDGSEYEIKIAPSRVKVDVSSSEYLEIDNSKIQGYFPIDIHVRDINRYFNPFSNSEKYPEVIETKMRGKGPIPTRLVIIKFKPQTPEAMFVKQSHKRCVMFDSKGKEHIIALSHPNAINGK